MSHNGAVGDLLSLLEDTLQQSRRAEGNTVTHIPMRHPGLGATAAYAYQGDLYCPAHIVGIGLASKALSPAAADLPVPVALERWWESVGADMDDEHTWDSDDAPKGVTEERLSDDAECGWCHAPLLDERWVEFPCPECGDPVDYCQGHGELG